MTGLTDLTAVTVAAAFVCGLVLTLPDYLRQALAKRLDIGEDLAGRLLAGLPIALVPMMLLAGLLTDRWGARSVLLTGSVAAAAGLFLLTMSRNSSSILGAMLLTGAGGAGLSTASCVLMPLAFWPAHPAASLNLGNVFFGLGALLTPVLADLLLHGLGYRRGVGLLAVAAVIPALLAAATSGSVFELPPGAHPADLSATLADPLVWLAGVVFFLYAPLETSLHTWAEPYLGDLGIQARRATWTLTGFWLMFLAARLLAALVFERGTLSAAAEPWLLVVLALTAAVLLGNLAGTNSRVSARAGIWTAGAVLGPIFPTLVGTLFGSFDRTAHGTVYGAMFAVGAIGQLVVTPFIAAAVRRTSGRRAMRIPLLLAIGLALAALVLGSMKSLLRG